MEKVMTRITKFATFFVLILLVLTNGYSQQNFDKEKDFLLLHNDTQFDPDDIHSIAAVASFLQHPDQCGVNYFGVIGTNWRNGSNFLPRAIEMAELVYGTENVDWANANKEFGNRGNARNLVIDRIKPIIDNGGKVWIAEAGQADFTFDVVMRLKELGVPEAKFKNQIVIVQHSPGNENTSNGSNLNYLRANTDYRKIDNGNNGPNNTPDYTEGSKTFLNEAKSAQNPNAITREYWTLADDIVDAWHPINNHKNNLMRNGGVDFSDAVEVWYIFDLGNSANSVRAVWDNYVLRTPTEDPCNIDPNNAPEVRFVNPSTTQFEEGIDLGVSVDATDTDGAIANVRLYFDDILIRQEGGAPYQWGTDHPRDGIDPALLNLKVGTYELKAVATDNDGASTETTMIVTVISTTLTINNIAIENGIRLFPNPVQKTLFIKANPLNKAIKIYDLLGVVKLEKSLMKGENAINISELSNGVYLVKIMDLNIDESDPILYKIMKTN